MDTHRYNVRQIAQQIRTDYDKKESFFVYHGTTNSTGHRRRSLQSAINTSHLSNILDINTKCKFAMVEPNVAMDTLVKETLKHGLIPAVVPGFPGTTVGGTFSGTAGGSSSFLYGYFDRTVTWVEMVLPDGKVARASNAYNADLFAAIVGTLGTIAITTLFQIKLVEALAYVETTYVPVSDPLELLIKTREYIEDFQYDFVESFIFGTTGPYYGVVVIGSMTNSIAHKERRFGRLRDPWFCIHAQDAGSCTETVRIWEYLFRYDRGAYIVGRLMFGRWLPFNGLTRRLFAPLMSSRRMANTLRSTNWSQRLIIQDLVVPIETITELIDYIENELSIYPLRLCPIRQYHSSIMRPNPLQTSMFIAIGIRGYTEDTARNFDAFKRKNRQIEQKVHELGGIKWLYANSYYTKDEFWSIYPQAEYEALRSKFNAAHLPDVYEKAKSTEIFESHRSPRGFWNYLFTRTSVIASKTKICKI